LGHRWFLIAQRLPNRTDHAIRNRWHRLQTMQTEQAQQRYQQGNRQLLSEHGVAATGQHPVLRLWSARGNEQPPPQQQQQRQRQPQHGPPLPLPLPRPPQQQPQHGPPLPLRDAFFDVDAFTAALTSGPKFRTLTAAQQAVAREKVQSLRPAFEEELAALRATRGQGASVTVVDIREMMPRVMARAARAAT